MNPPIRDWRGLRVWIVGASSGIGAELAKHLHRQGAQLILSARRHEAMLALGLDGAKLLACDLRNAEQLSRTCATALEILDGIDVVVWMAGVYQPVTVDNYREALALDITQTNYVALLHVLGDLLAHFRQPAEVRNGVDPHPKSGQGASPRGLVLVSSVAGYRGLPKALAYGPSKAALTHLAEILHLELAPRGVGVWVIHPGFVQTPATAINDFHMPALISAEQAAQAIVRGLGRSAFEIHFPRRFTFVMKALALLPYSLYFALMQRGMRPAKPGSPAKLAPARNVDAPKPQVAEPALPAAPRPFGSGDAIVQFFERLSPESLDQLAQIYRPEARFKDPFHEVVGIAAIRDVLAHMFRKLPGGTFVVTGCLSAENPRTADPAGASTGRQVPVPAQLCLTWDYRVEFAGKAQCIRGCSWLELAEDGRIAVHRDYWDLAEELYEKIPGLAVVMRWLKRQAKAG